MSEGYYEDYADFDGDGQLDDLQVESNEDGSTTYMVSTDEDSTAEIEVTDADSDGVYDSGTDSVEMDTDNDGVYDASY
ncbi:MAG: hypothetical protein ACRDT4_19255 [Micromonosporaceae bacterium]